MKPEVILKSDVLDIIFENRNKEYGAYALRKKYNHRLIQAMGGTFLLVGLFFLLQSMRPIETEQGAFIFPGVTELAEVDLKDPLDKPKDPPRPQQQQEQLRTITNTAPVITPEAPETTVAPQELVTNTNIGSAPAEGQEGIPGNPYNTSPGEATITATPAPAEPEFDAVTVREHADVMPAFNGDVVKFMLRHLRQPDDLEQGERILVRVRFVVDAEGGITNIQVVQSGRRDLDEEVIRVVKKMPRWRPGMQGGRAVPVYFNMPVTFVNNAE